MSIPMIVKKAFRPGGSNSPKLEPGSPFEASGRSQARAYRALGWAEEAPPQTVTAPTYQRRDMRAEELGSNESAPAPATNVPAKKVAAKRVYARRDFAATE